MAFIFIMTRNRGYFNVFLPAVHGMLVHMEADERSIAATLAYYGALRWPLTVVEVARRAIPSARLGIPGFDPTPGSVLAVADRLATQGTIRVSSGLLTFADGIDEDPAALRR